MSRQFSVIEGQGPLLVTIPHAGLEIPGKFRDQFTEVGLSGQDADVFVDDLYSFTKAQGITTLISDISRYVVDLNRSPKDEDLYPGKFTTGVVPIESFKKEPLYKEGKEPDVMDRANRIREYFFPYHYEIEKTLSEKKQEYGRALLWDAHSVKSEVPSLFKGKLPDFNFGTNNGKSCGLAVEEAFSRVMKEEFPEFSFVFNGRFKGGYTTRHYGRPKENIHAIQLELSQATYLNEETGGFSDEKAVQVKAALARLVQVYQGLG